MNGAGAILPILTITSFWAVVAVGAGWLARAYWMRQQALRAIFADDERPAEAPSGAEQRWFLSRWLYLAGFRAPSAPLIFCLLTGLLLVGGLSVAWLTWQRGAVTLMADLLYAIPGGVGEVFLPLAYASPWLTVLLLTALPALYVRNTRRRRVQLVEQDLPVTIDLLATLAEAGLGFDSAIERILASQAPGRPLAQELRTFQVDLMAGRTRLEALRRLGRRLDVPWFNIFISAVIQAERVGAGLAEVLRAQAIDLRHRRRERALGFAMALPAKMTLPLVACFLPAIAVVVLGPAIFGIFLALDGLMR